MLIYMHFILILEDGVLHRKDNLRVKALWVTTLASHTLCITTYTEIQVATIIFYRCVIN